VRRTLSNTGTVSKETFPKCTLQIEEGDPAKNEKVTRKATFNSSVKKVE
jgi:hypothetical protein